MNRPLARIIIYTLVAATCGCATSRPTVDPSEEAATRSGAIVDRAIDDAAAASDDLDSYTVPLRYNPCKCEAPPHEIYAYGHWNRVFLEGDEALLEEIEAHFGGSDRPNSLASVSVEGAFDGHDTTASNIEFAVFRIETIEEDDESE
ncbi:MAG: hypothetical protein ACOC9W_04945 [Persicimonas sp.]